MRHVKKLVLSLLVMLSVTMLTPSAIPFIEESHGIVLQAADKNSKTVYITPTGKKYHARKCGRGSYRKASLEDAKALGLTACKKCY